MRYEVTITDTARGTEKVRTFNHTGYVGSTLVDEDVLPADYQVSAVNRVFALEVGRMAWFQSGIRSNTALVTRTA